MANYDTKLGEWFKLVEQREQELKAKRSADNASPPEPPEQPAPSPQAVSVEPPVAETAAPTLDAIPEREVVADTGLVEPPPPDQEEVEQAQFQQAQVEQAGVEPDAGPSLFEDQDVPEVEEFLSFLSRSRESQDEKLDQPPFEILSDQGPLSLGEGTGEPRPILDSPPAEPETEVLASRQRLAEPAAARPQAVRPSEPKPAPAPPDAQPAEAPLHRLSQRLETLISTAGEEVAQHSYKAFKETRAELIERLLDPVVSLEEAARILNVCPTTVRRYTNRGILEHIRTGGNQRRFKLTDVLAFMESGGKQREKT